MTLASLAQRHPRWIDAGIHLDRVPPLAWLALQATALLPTWTWMAARVVDRSDDPLGLLALAALGWLVWLQRRDLRTAPRLGWLAAAAAGTVAATLLRALAWPLLLTGLLSVVALACGLLAFLPPRRAGEASGHGVASLPVLGLAVLALPLLSSLQFYAGYPLRVITAEASHWLLAPFFHVQREGSSLWIDGRLVIVDAPCSGVQMVWLGYFTACVVALFFARPPREEQPPRGGQQAIRNRGAGGPSLDNRRFLRRLPAVSALVLLGNVLRNAVLMGLEGAGRPLTPWAHEALGLAALAGVCGAIAMAMQRSPRSASRPVPGLNTLEGTRHVDTRA